MGASWKQIALAHTQRSEAAALALLDYREVQRLEYTATYKAGQARERAARADEEASRAQIAAQAAHDSARALREAMRDWTPNSYHNDTLVYLLIRPLSRARRVELPTFLRSGLVSMPRP